MTKKTSSTQTSLAALYYDNCLVQYNENGRYYHKNVPSLNIKKLPKAVTMFVAKNNIYGFAQGTIRLDGSEYYVGLDPDFETGEEYDDTKAFNVKEVSDRLTVRLMMNVTKEDLPMYFGVRGGEDFVLYFPQSMAKAVRPGFKLGSTEGNIYTWFFIKTKEHAKVAALLKQTDMGIGNYESRSRFVLDNTESMEREISMAKILNVLSTGFIALISLICAANAFNTISTSIYLRRREFAMLRSAGMSRKGFSK